MSPYGVTRPYWVAWRHQAITWTNFKLDFKHDIITRNAYIVSWAEIWEFSKSQGDIIDAVAI